MLHICFIDEKVREHMLHLASVDHEDNPIEHMLVFTHEQLEDLHQMQREGKLREDVEWINCDPPDISLAPR